MPTTPLRNILYRLSLPFLAPGPGFSPELKIEGRPIVNAKAYSSLLRRHHVLGSACLLASKDKQSVILSSSSRPEHTARRGTMFRVASITKMAAALCALRLCDQGKLSLDEPVARYFPDERFPSTADTITLRQLLSHTSGLLDPPDFETRVVTGVPFPKTLTECPHTEPGKAFHYSNFGYGLIGCLFEAVTNKTVSQVLDEMVFQPLRMRATLDPTTLNANDIMPITRVLPWRKDQDVIITNLGRVPLKSPDPLRHYGHTAGSMYTDIDSLAALLRCLMNDGSPLISGDLGREARRVHAVYGALSPTLSYGLGLLIIQDPALSSSRILGHQGFAYGCADAAFWEEDTGRMIIFLNGGCSEARSGRLGLCNRDILKLFLQKEFPRWEQK